MQVQVLLSPQITNLKQFKFTIMATLSSGLKQDFSQLTGAKFTGTSNHDSKWGLLANFDNGFNLLFLAGNPSAKWLFSDNHKGLTCDGTNKQGLPNLI